MWSGKLLNDTHACKQNNAFSVIEFVDTVTLNLKQRDVNINTHIIFATFK